jgi:outer membrane receptor for ferrienterochelin and colicins
MSSPIAKLHSPSSLLWRDRGRYSFWRDRGRYLLFLIFFSNSVSAQLSISITDQDTKTPISQAIINAYCTTKLQQFKTDTNGIAQIPMADKNCFFTIEAAGYDTKYNVLFGLQTSINIALEKKNTLLQDIVVTGQAKHVLAEKSMYKVNVINTATLRQQAANTLGDALATQNNFFKQQDNILGSTVNMQGIGGQNIKILLNGVPLNGRENGNIDINQINVANADRIEIVKGPMSVLYGTDALGGVINIITKANPEKLQFGIYSYAESINKWNNNINIGAAKKRHSFSANLAHNYFGGYIYTDSLHRSQLWKPKTQYTVDGNYTYATSKGRLIYTPSIMLETIMNRGVPNIDAFGAYGIDEYYKTKRIANTIIADYELDSLRKLTFSNTVSYYSRIKNRLAKDLINSTEQQTINAGDQDTSTFIDYNFRGFYHSKHNAVASFMVGYEVNVQQAISDKLKSRNTIATNKALVADFASYITVPIQLSKTITIQPAVRIANNTFYKAPITPSFNIRMALPKQMVLRASYARGFRAPSLKELYLNFVDVNHNVTGNDSLLPEKSHQLQLHIDAPMHISKQVIVKLGNSTYYNNINNQISLVAVNTALNAYQYNNVDNFTNICNETNLQLQYKKWRNNIGFSLNHIYTADSNRGFTNTEINYSTNYQIPKTTMTINVNYRYIGKQAILGISTIGADAAYNAYLPATHFADANFTLNPTNIIKRIALKLYSHNKSLKTPSNSTHYTWLPSPFSGEGSGVRLQCGIRNIFAITSLAIQGNPNTSIHGGNGQQIISPGRSFFIGIRYNFN